MIESDSYPAKGVVDAMSTRTKTIKLSHVYSPENHARSIAEIIHELVDEAVSKALMSYASK